MREYQYLQWMIYIISSSIIGNNFLYEYIMISLHADLWYFMYKNDIQGKDKCMGGATW